MTAGGPRERRRVRDLVDDFNPHASGSSGDCSRGLLDTSCVHVFKFDFCDFHLVFRGNGTDFLGSRVASTFGDFCFLLQQNSRWRTFDDEVKRSVIVDRNHNRHSGASHVLRFVVELLDELPDVHTVWTKCGTNRRSRSCLAANNLNFNLGLELLSHDSNFLFYLQPQTEEVWVVVMTNVKGASPDPGTHGKRAILVTPARNASVRREIFSEILKDTEVGDQKQMPSREMVLLLNACFLLPGHMASIRLSPLASAPVPLGLTGRTPQRAPKFGHCVRRCRQWCLRSLRSRLL